jgi:hypothetical protein
MSQLIFVKINKLPKHFGYFYQFQKAAKSKKLPNLVTLQVITKQQ